MKKDKRLEELSDKVRRGEPIGFGEALEVIQYQHRGYSSKLDEEYRQKVKQNKVSLKDKIINLFKWK